MAWTRFCCCSVITWCYIMIICDMINGAYMAGKHFRTPDELNGTEKLNLTKVKPMESSILKAHDMCLDLGIGIVGSALEMSLLLIAFIGLFGLCCRKAILLIPYLVMEVVVIALHVYLAVQYIIHYDQCKNDLTAQIISLIFSTCAYCIIFGAYKMIRSEQYSAVPPDF